MILLQVTLVCLAALVLEKINNSESAVNNCGHECPKTCLCPCKQSTGECTEGCVAGYYGYNCNKTCDPRCRKNVCVQNGGRCACELGYRFSNSRCEKDAGKQCPKQLLCLNDRCSSTGDEECLEGCKPGRFGLTCQKQCEDNCFCDQVLGNCTDCVTGWFGPECQSQCSTECTEGCHKNGSCIDGCKPGSYGEQCDIPCSRHCVSGCDQLSGECVQCEAGRYGPTCQSECSAWCAGCDREGTCIKGCVKGYYGEKCESTCPEQCVSGLCNLNGTCVTCMTGFYGAACIARCEECLDGDCSKDTGECINRAEDGTESLPYIIGGGVLLIVVVLAVFMVCCLKRMQGIVDNGMKSIGENSVVHFEPVLSASVCSMNNTRVCGSHHASENSTYNHLFAFKPFSVDSSFDNHETASGYCSVLLRDRVVINDGHDTQSAASLADFMFDDVEACSGVQKEDGGAKKTCEIIFLQSKEDKESVFRYDNGNGSARNVRDISKLTNVDSSHVGIGDWAGGKSGLQFKEDEKYKHHHTHDGEDKVVIHYKKGSKLTYEKEALRNTRAQGDQDDVKKLSMACGDLHSSDAEDSNGKETREDAGDYTRAVLIEREDKVWRSPDDRRKSGGEVGAGGSVRRKESHHEGKTTSKTWEGFQSINREAKEDGAWGGTISGEGNDSSIIVDDEDNDKTGVSNECSCHISTEGFQLQSSRDDLFYDGSQKSTRNDDSDSSQRKTKEKECNRYPYVDIIVT